MATCQVAQRLVALLRMIEHGPAPYGAGPDVDDAVLDAWFGARSGVLPIDRYDGDQLSASGSSNSGPLLRTEFTSLETA